MMERNLGAGDPANSNLISRPASPHLKFSSKTSRSWFTPFNAVFASLGVVQLTRHDRSSISSACLFTTSSRASSLTRVYSVRSSPAVISGSNNVYSIALVSDVVVQDVIPIFWLDPPVGLLGVLLDKASHRLVVAAGVHA